MTISSRTNNSLHHARQTLSNWWRSAAQPHVTQLTVYSAENNLLISGITMGLATAGFLYSPFLQLLAAPSLLLLALPSYQEAIEAWQDDRQVGDAALEASLMTLFVATNHLALGAAGMLLLAAGQRASKSADGNVNDILPTIALSTLALPVAGLSGAAATMYARIGRHNPRHVAQHRLQNHNINIRDWEAVEKLPELEIAILDQSCLIQQTLKGVQAFRHHLREEVLFYAATAASPMMRQQIRQAYPKLATGKAEIDVQLLTPHQVRSAGLLAPVLTDEEDYLCVVVGGRLIGVLEISQTVHPEADQLLSALSQADLHVILLSESNLSQTQALATTYAIETYHANLNWQQKVDFCQSQPNTCFISREAFTMGGVTDLTITLGEDENADVALCEQSFDALTHAMHAYSNQKMMRQAFATAPTVLTVGGVFFLQWGVPAAVAIQGASVLTNYWVDRRFKRQIHQPNTVDGAPDPEPQQVLNAPTM